MNRTSRPRTESGPLGTVAPIDYTYDVPRDGIIRVVDGDTVDLRVVDRWHGDPMLDGDTLVRESEWFDMGFHVQLQQRTWTRVTSTGFTIGAQVRGRYTHRFRVLGIDTPERGAPLFKAANDFTRDWLSARAESESLRVRSAKADSFGRWLADVIDVRDGSTLTVALLGAGYARYVD